MGGYTPGDLGAQLVAAGDVVMPWVGVAVTAAAALYLVFVGIRAGFRFFRDVIDMRRGFADEYWAEIDADEMRHERMTGYYEGGYEAAINAGRSESEAHEFATQWLNAADSRGEFD